MSFLAKWSGLFNRQASSGHAPVSTQSLCRCFYCGTAAEYPARSCLICKADFPDADQESPLRPPKAPAASTIVHLKEVPGAIVDQGGLPWLNWPIVQAHLISQTAVWEQEQARREVVGQWLDELCAGLGERAYYAVPCESGFIVCSYPPHAGKELATMLDRLTAKVLAKLGPAASPEGRGVWVVLFLHDAEAMDHYLHSLAPQASYGIGQLQKEFICTGFPHAVLRFPDFIGAHAMVVRTFTDRALSHLPLPRWLRHGTRAVMPRYLLKRAPAADAHLASLHGEFWASHDIQTFWAGVSVSEDQQVLAGNLAELLVERLAPARAFVEFLQQADFRDAGKAAAEELLALNLGAVLREFLGDGNWEPDPDQIAACQLSPRDPEST